MSIVQYGSRALRRLASRFSRPIIFIHVPKSAGTFIRNALPGRVIVCRHNLRDASFRHPEAVIAQMRRKPTVFSIVRDPLTRCVSAYRYLQRGGSPSHPQDQCDAERFVLRYGSFAEFVRTEVASGDVLQQLHFRPQAFWLSSTRGRGLADIVCRFESLREDIAKVEHKTGLDLADIRAAWRPPRPTEEDIPEDCKRIVADAYSVDYEMFRY